MSLSLVQQCLQDVSDWMIASQLKLNPDKTEFILIGTKAQRDKSKKYFTTKLLDQDVTPTDSAQNLGVEFDKDFNFKKHISKVCRSCYYHIRDLRRLRRCLTAAVTKTIATSLVLSKLDYCNSILYNIPNREINKVQNVQNCLARVVTPSPQFCRVTPLVKSLHWLPVQFRIKHKICTLTYEEINSCQPVYLHNLLKPLNRTCNLGSSDDDQLVVPRASSKMSKRAFSVAAPQLCNCIPLEIKKSKSAVLSEKIDHFIFRPSLSLLNPLCPCMLDLRIGTSKGQ